MCYINGWQGFRRSAFFKGDARRFGCFFGGPQLLSGVCYEMTFGAGMVGYGQISFFFDQPPKQGTRYVGWSVAGGAGGGPISGFGFIMSPTINVGWRRFEDQSGTASPTLVAMRAALKRLRAAGVPLIASPDAGIPRVRHQDLPLALPVFARFAGFTAPEVLRAATSAAADVLGLRRVCGRLAPELSADVLVLDRDPTRDLAALARPVSVFARGRHARD